MKLLPVCRIEALFWRQYCNVRTIKLNCSNRIKNGVKKNRTLKENSYVRTYNSHTHTHKAISPFTSGVPFVVENSLVLAVNTFPRMTGTTSRE